MTPEHNPPKDPSLAETTVLPRVEAPDGYRRLVIRETILPKDRALKKDLPLDLFDDQSIETFNAGATVKESDGNFYYRPIAPAPQAPRDGAQRLEDGSGFFVPAQAPVLGDATAPVDKAELDKLCAFILMNFTGEWDRKESTADVAIRYLKSVSILKDALTQAREALAQIILVTDPDLFPTTRKEAVAALALLESPALVSIIQPDGGKA